MKLLANENFPLTSVRYLERKCFDIKAIGVDSPSISDREVMAIAIRETRTILTYDSDYGGLIFKHNFQPPGGVIYIPILTESPIEAGKLVEDLLSTEELVFERTLTVVDIHGIRQRRY